MLKIEILRSEQKTEQNYDGLPDPIQEFFRFANEYPPLTRQDKDQSNSIISKGIEAERKIRIISETNSNPEDQEELNYLVKHAYEERKKLFLHNLLLIPKTIRQYWIVDKSYPELIQEGVIALYNASLKYDPAKGEFSSYAINSIRNYIVNHAAENDELHPHVSKNYANKVRKSRKKILGESGDGKIKQEELIKMISKETGISEKTVIALLTALNSPLSLDQTFEDDSENDLSELIPDQNIPIPEQIEQNELREILSELLHELEPQEEIILRLRFGLDNGDIYTLEEIGNMLGVSRQRIYQIEAEALRRLRHPRRTRCLKDFY